MPRPFRDLNTRIADDLAKLDGTPPYDEPSNHCRNDTYYAASLEKKYKVSIDTLRDWIK